MNNHIIEMSSRKEITIESGKQGKAAQHQAATETTYGNI